VSLITITKIYVIYAHTRALNTRIRYTNARIERRTLSKLFFRGRTRTFFRVRARVHCMYCCMTRTDVDTGGVYLVRSLFFPTDGRSVVFCGTRARTPAIASNVRVCGTGQRAKISALWADRRGGAQRLKTLRFSGRHATQPTDVGHHNKSYRVFELKLVSERGGLVFGKEQPT